MFSDNKYSKWYLTLIHRARTRVFSGKPSGYHKHHILPRCLGGGDEAENLCLLTYREHLIAHMLLVKMTSGKNQVKMAHALRRFGGKNKCSRSFATAARLMSMAMSGKNNPMAGRPLTPAHRAKITGEKHGMHGKNLMNVWTEKFGVEGAQKLAEQRKKKLSEKVKGEKNGMFGVVRTDAQKQHQASQISGRIGLLGPDGKQHRLPFEEAVLKHREGWRIASTNKYRAQKIAERLSQAATYLVKTSS